MKHTQVIDNHRVTLWGSSIRFVDLTNAGKRGKYCTEHIFRFLNLHDGIEKAKTIYSDHQGKTIEETISNISNSQHLLSLEVENLYHKGVDISPDLPSIEISTDKWDLDCRVDGKGSFDLTISDLTDRNNDPTIIFSHRNTKTEKAKVYRLISENKEHLKNLSTMGNVYDFIHRATGIYLHSYCAVD